jgi:LemA protein
MPVLWLLLVLMALLVTAAVIGHQLLLQRLLACQEARDALRGALKRRYALVPNLCDLAEEHAAHEKSVLQQVRAARQGAGQAEGVEQQQEAQRNLGRSLQKLLELARRYPGLGSSLEFQRVRRELASVESQILAAIESYNQRVEKYLQLRQTPGLHLLARVLRQRVPEEFDAALTAVVVPDPTRQAQQQRS